MPDFFTQHMLRPGGPFKQAVVAAPGGVPAAPPQGAPPQGMPMDPSMMGLPAAPPQGMVAQASFEGDDDAASLVRAAMDFLR